MSNTCDSNNTRNVCEWITVTVPADIHDASSSSSQLWRTIVHALINLMRFDGVQGCDWSRVLEQSSQLYIWISWTHRYAYDAHVDLEAHELLYEKLRLLSISVVNTKVVQYDMPSCYSGGGQLARCWPSITLVHFPGRLTKEQPSQVDASQSMTKCTGCYSQWMDSRTLGGFVFHETNSHDDHESLRQDTRVVLDRWVSPVREEEVKSLGEDGKHKTPARDRLDRAQSPPPQFVEQMTALGCTRIDTRHMRFTHVIAPTDPYEEKELYAQDIEAKGFDFDWVKDRKMWKTEKKARMSYMTPGCRRSMIDDAAMKRRILLAEDRDFDADRQKRKKGLRANGQLKLRQDDYKGMRLIFRVVVKGT